MSDFSSQADMTEEEIQDVFLQAHEKMVALTEKHRNHEVFYPQLLIVTTVIHSVQTLSKSCNGIPGLRGLGLENTLLLCQQILEKDVLNPRDFTLKFREIVNGVMFN